MGGYRVIVREVGVGGKVGVVQSQDRRARSSGSFEGMPTPSWRRIGLLALLAVGLVVLTALIIYLVRG